MTILDIELSHFGKFHRKKITFSQGLNVIYGNNETGKSTIHAFIQCMLFGMDTTSEGQDSFYRKYYPWDDQGGYSGIMRIKIAEHVYRIERSFLAENSRMRLTDETTGEELTPADVRLKELTEGLNETNFVNTISIGQLQNTAEINLIGELEHFIANTAQTKNVRIDMIRAKEKLNARSDELKRRYLEGADDEYRRCEEKLEAAQQEYSRLQDQQYQQEQRYEELKESTQQKQRQSTEDMLAYERERDIRRRQYEAAKKNWASVPQTEGHSQGYFMILFFAVLFLLFAAGIGYLYWKEGFEDPVIRNAAAGFSAALLICLIGLMISIGQFVRRRKQLLTESRIRTKLREQLDDSVTRFEECKKAAPKGIEESFEAANQELENLKKEMAQNSIWVDHWKKECDKLQLKQQQIRSNVAENNCVLQELEAVELAMKTLDTVAVRVQETFGNRLCKEASVILARITEGKYDRIHMTGKKEIRIGSADRLYPLRSVSRGTVEQVYLSIRVAAADLLWQKSPMPFIFDDVFAYYDDDRLESAMNMLKDSGHQAIIFSCNTREDRLIDAG